MLQLNHDDKHSLMYSLSTGPKVEHKHHTNTDISAFIKISELLGFRQLAGSVTKRLCGP